jgi:hypothetical protein
LDETKDFPAVYRLGAGTAVHLQGWAVWGYFEVFGGLSRPELSVEKWGMECSNLSKPT